MVDPLYRFADAETRTRTLVHGAGVVLAAFVVGIGLAAIGAVAFRAAGVSADPAPPEANAVVTALQFVGFLAVGYWYVARIADSDLLYLRRPTVRDVGWVILGLFALSVTILSLDVLLARLDVEVATNAAIEAGREQPRLLLYFVVVTLFLVAPGEELIFRGLLQGLIRRAYGVVPAIVLTAAVFGLVHYVALGGTGSRLVYVVIAALLGLVLGTVYEYTENLVVPVVIHGCWNAGQFLLVYADEVGWAPL